MKEFFKSRMIQAAFMGLIGVFALIYFQQQTIKSKVEVKESTLESSPIVVDSPNTEIDIDNSIIVNKPLPEIEFGTLTDFTSTEVSPYEYSFVLRYSTTMDTPASYSVEYINLELYEVVSGDETDTEIFLGSRRIKESFNMWGMRYKLPHQTISFNSKEKVENLKLKLVMEVEGRLKKEASVTIWEFGGK